MSLSFDARSSIYSNLLFIFCAINIIITFSHLFTDIGVLNQTAQDNILKLLESNFYENCLIANIAIALPYVLEYLSDLITDLYRRNIHIRSRSLLYVSASWLPSQKTILMVSLVYPNLINIIVSIPSKNFNIFLSIFASRLVLVLYAFSFNIMVMGGSYFKSNWFLIGNMLQIFSITLAAEGGLINEWLIWVAIGIAVIGKSILVYLYYLWFRSINIKEISILQINCICHILLDILLGLVILITVIIDGEYGYYFLIIITCSEGLVALSLIIVDSRSTKLENLANKDKILNMKRTLIRFLSHEIRTPLNTVFMGLHMIRKKHDEQNDKNNINIEFNNETSQLIDEMENACNTSLDILNDLLTYEKIDAGVLVLDKVTVDAFSIVHESLKAFHLQARQMEIEFHNIDQSLVIGNLLTSTHIHVDRNRMSQVIRNLLSNAMKFTPRGGRVTVTACHIKDIIEGNNNNSNNNEMRNLLRIEVKDTGSGISQENISKLFKEVIQFNPGTLQDGGGSGFGLYLSKAIVDLHDSRISVTSEGEGLGTTFILDIPIKAIIPISISDNIPTSIHIENDENESIHSTRTSSRINTNTDINVNIHNANMSSGHPVDLCNIMNNTVINDDKKVSNLHFPIKNLGIHNNIGSNKIYPILSREDFTIDDIAHINTPDTIRDTTIIPFTTSITTINNDKCKRILIVDDAISNRKCLSRLLKDEYITEEADDGKIALTKVLESMKSNDMNNKYDVVLIDYQMPNMDGPTSVKLMRDAGYDGLIIGITGNALEKDLLYFKNQGVNEVLTKPVNTPQLKNILLSSDIYKQTK